MAGARAAPASRRLGTAASSCSLMLPSSPLQGCTEQHPWTIQIQPRQLTTTTYSHGHSTLLAGRQQDILLVQWCLILSGTTQATATLPFRPKFQNVTASSGDCSLEVSFHEILRRREPGQPPARILSRPPHHVSPLHAQRRPPPAHPWLATALTNPARDQRAPPPRGRATARARQQPRSAVSGAGVRACPAA
jgi:hypothetical protein